MAFADHTEMTTAVGLMVFVGTAILSLYLQPSLNEKSKQSDLLLSILQNTAPVAAANELRSLPPGCRTCERRLNGTPLILTKDPVVAAYVFTGKNRSNYVQRPASDDGLKKLGMFCSGLIWNNDEPLWQSIRGCFQKALKEANLKKAVSVVQNEAVSMLDQKANDGTDGVDLLGVCRCLTFRATLKVFFGIDSFDFAKMGVDEDAFISAIVCFFKAWEYFLLRPEEHWDDAQSKRNSKAVLDLQDHVREMLESIGSRAGSLESNGIATQSGSGEANRPTPKLFVESLREVCDKENSKQDLYCQSALEMLLAGTDTSSVTAYYTLLALAGDRALQEDLREELSEVSGSSPLLESIVNETLRFKPVGPVVLRQAGGVDPDFPLNIRIERGTALLIHLAEMNLEKEVWSSPRRFLPRRFVGAPSTQEYFFPFGLGPKGCVGSHLGRREVNAIVGAAIQNYDLKIVGKGTLESLETHWDIANQPDDPIRIHLGKRTS